MKPLAYVWIDHCHRFLAWLDQRKLYGNETAGRFIFPDPPAQFSAMILTMANGKIIAPGGAKVGEFVLTPDGDIALAQYAEISRKQALAARK